MPHFRKLTRWAAQEMSLTLRKVVSPPLPVEVAYAGLRREIFPQFIRIMKVPTTLSCWKTEIATPAKRFVPKRTRSRYRCAGQRGYLGPKPSLKSGPVSDENAFCRSLKVPQKILKNESSRRPHNGTTDERRVGAPPGSNGSIFQPIAGNRWCQLL